MIGVQWLELLFGASACETLSNRRHIVADWFLTAEKTMEHGKNKFLKKEYSSRTWTLEEILSRSSAMTEARSSHGSGRATCGACTDSWEAEENCSNRSPYARSIPYLDTMFMSICDSSISRWQGIFFFMTHLNWYPQDFYDYPWRASQAHIYTVTVVAAELKILVMRGAKHSRNTKPCSKAKKARKLQRIEKKDRSSME